MPTWSNTRPRLPLPGMLDVPHLWGMLCAFGDDSPVVSTFED
jgi:hypothetical protein